MITRCVTMIEKAEECWNIKIYTTLEMDDIIEEYFFFFTSMRIARGKRWRCRLRNDKIANIFEG